MLKEKIDTLDASIFRSYDIRGIVGKTLTDEAVYFIGKTLGSIALEHGEEEMAIARDGRSSSPALSHVLCAGILSSGCHVVDLGMVPTPLLYYATHVLTSRSGVMLTGSHNPPDYNGLKMVIKGKSLAEAEIKQIYTRIQQEDYQSGAGVKHDLNLVERYMKEVLNNVHLKRPLNIVIDAGNGVTGMIAPQLFRALGCNVQTLFCEVDGTFPHHHPDPSQTENLQDLIQAVTEKKADIGLAFDGDGDRLGIVTAKGEVIWPDRLLMLFAKAILAEHQDLAAKAKIIFDVKCSNHLANLIIESGGEALMWKTGHSLIKAKLAETNAKLAGEMSGHFFFKDRWYGFDDALYAGARLLEILAQTEKTSDEIFAAIPNSINTPELKVLVKEEEKFQLMQELISRADFKTADVMTIDGLRVNFAEGWGLVRPSNTTPYLILRFEALNEGILKEIQSLFRHWMLSVKPDLVLPF